MDIADVTIPNHYRINKQQLLLNGAGIRTKYFIDLYIGSLYLPHHADNFKDVISQPNLVIQLNIISNLITAEKMQQAITEGFDAATNGHIQPLLPTVNQFMNLFNQKINYGDKFTLVMTNNAVKCYKNDILLNTLLGKNFRDALISVWLGPKPSQQSLKLAMLGQE